MISTVSEVTLASLVTLNEFTLEIDYIRETYNSDRASTNGLRQTERYMQHLHQTKVRQDLIS